MKKKYLGLVAAVLLGVTPVAGVVANSIHPTIVQAADDEDEQTATLWLKKKKPYLVAKNGESVEALIKRPVRDVTSNVSKVTNMIGIAVYHNMDNGDPDYTKAMSLNNTLRKGNSYSAVLTFNVKNGGNYSRLLQDVAFDTSDYNYIDLFFRSGDDSIPKITAAGDGSYGMEDAVSIVVPIKVKSNKSTSSVKKVNLKGYVKGKKNAKVKTYTSTGKTTKTKVYGHHTYKLNRKKTIKGKTYYKVYGKSYWIRASKLVIK